jgi:bifunctional pyridoxal-dependent enzyme with beta-cystathionase and maltose regulon repressor activities
MARLKSAKVMVAYGHSFGTGWYEEDGGFWVRLTVAVSRATLWDGLHRIEFAMGYK